MSADSGQCPLSDVATLSVSLLLRNFSFATRTCMGTHPRAHAVGSHGVISMECLGRLGSKKSGRVSSCICVHPREFSSSVAYPRAPLPSFADYSRLPRIARDARFYVLEICEIGYFAPDYCGYSNRCTKQKIS